MDDEGAAGGPELSSAALHHCPVVVVGVFHVGGEGEEEEQVVEVKARRRGAPARRDGAHAHRTAFMCASIFNVGGQRHSRLHRSYAEYETDTWVPLRAAPGKLETAACMATAAVDA